MFLKSPVLLTHLFDQARMHLNLRDLYAAEAISTAARRPVASLGTVFLLAAASSLLVSTVQSSSLDLSQPVAAPARPIPAQPASIPVSIDAEAVNAAQRKEKIMVLERHLSMTAPQKQNLYNLQIILNDLDYHAGRNDGIFGPRTASGLMSALEENPQLVKKISPHLIENLLQNGQRQAFKKMIATRPDIKMIAGNCLDQPDASIRDKQIWLSAFGLYKKEIDNSRGPATIAAENQFRHLNQAPLPQQPSAQREEPHPLPSSHAAFGTPLSATEISELETILHKGGYYQQKPTGRFNRALGGALVEYLRDHQDQLAHLSPWVLQKMMRHNYQQDLVGLMYGNSSAEQALRTKITTAASRLSALEPKDLAETQIWLKMTGLYTGPVTGQMNPRFQSALSDVASFSALGRTLRDGSSGTVQNLARNQVFRQALQNGDLRTSIRMIEALDTTPLRMQMPLPVMIKTSDYKPRRKTSLDRYYRPHMGTDYGAASRTPIRAPLDGAVVFNGYANRYGNTIIISHGYGIHTLMAHRCRSSNRLAVGQNVRAGDTIGKVGSTGRTTNPHLHFEIILHDPSGNAVPINAHKFAGRNLKDPQVQQEAIADARLTMNPSGSKTLRSRMGSHIPANKPVITPEIAKRFLEIFAADRGIYARTSSYVVSALRDAGLARELDRFARVQDAEPMPKYRTASLMP